MQRTSCELLRYPSGVRGWKTPGGVRGRAPRFCFGLRWGDGLWDFDFVAARFGRGARPRAGCVVAPRPKWWSVGEHSGGKPRGEPARLELFLHGVYAGAWSGAEAEVDAPRALLTALAALAGRTKASRRHMACRSAGRGCRSRSGTERAGVPSKKRIIGRRVRRPRGFQRGRSSRSPHLVLDGASGASAVASPRARPGPALAGAMASVRNSAWFSFRRAVKLDSRKDLLQCWMNRSSSCVRR